MPRVVLAIFPDCGCEKRNSRRCRVSIRDCASTRVTSRTTSHLGVLVFTTIQIQTSAEIAVVVVVRVLVFQLAFAALSLHT